MKIKTIKRRKDWPKWAKWYAVSTNKEHLHAFLFEDEPGWMISQEDFNLDGWSWPYATKITSTETGITSLRRIV